MKKGNLKFWIFWLVTSFAGGGFLLYELNTSDKGIYLPGRTSDGHYQIELACEACHTDSFTNAKQMQEACIDCHGKELKVADDSHPKSKFTDPRNADRVEKLDARFCVTCHVEHKPEITETMGVTVPKDVCYLCHYDIAEDRASHKGMEFTTCASAGCHNFHDNRGIYEDFLLKHAGEPENKTEQIIPARDFSQKFAQFDSYPTSVYPPKPLTLKETDSPSDGSVDQRIASDWSETAHARSGVNCSACHAVDKDGNRINWVDKPSYTVCSTCHANESDTFLIGKHGMRLKQGLPPMSPADARIPMKHEANNKTLTCNSCHKPHSFDTQFAAVDACLSCHEDDHSLAYKGSPHYRAWLNTSAQASYGESDDENNRKVSGSEGASCATCHMPRVEITQEGIQRILVMHNQNDNLRPNEKMLRDVCMHCHGLGFSIDALADKELINNNFKGSPRVHIESIEFAVKRVRDKKESSSSE